MLSMDGDVADIKEQFLPKNIKAHNDAQNNTRRTVISDKSYEQLHHIPIQVKNAKSR